MLLMLPHGLQPLASRESQHTHTHTHTMTVNTLHQSQQYTPTAHSENIAAHYQDTPSWITQCMYVCTTLYNSNIYNEWATLLLNEVATLLHSFTPVATLLHSLHSSSDPTPLTSLQGCSERWTRSQRIRWYSVQNSLLHPKTTSSGLTLSALLGREEREMEGGRKDYYYKHDLYIHVRFVYIVHTLHNLLVLY